MTDQTPTPIAPARVLTDAQLRAAAARRPGYATYPEYRPGQPERLGCLPAVPARPAALLTARSTSLIEDEARALEGSRVAAGQLWSATLSMPPADGLDARPPLPAQPAEPEAVTLAALPEVRVFDFQPRRIDARPWWRRRWHWGVLAAGAQTRHGYAWTETGARRRTTRAVRRAERHG
ncbi:hypothetical protein ABZ807_05600 [Micromonospora sp. NPDC047548]|uniref:hypothetical protein n=1 Tax=Micromonospora sp. NPDC047548 TaxID=3155624 RepID=UPI00340ED246